MNSIENSEIPHVNQKEDGLRAVDYLYFAGSAGEAFQKILHLRLLGVGLNGVAFDYFSEKETREQEARLVARLDVLNFLGRDLTFELLQLLSVQYPQFREAIDYLIRKFDTYYNEKYNSSRCGKHIRQDMRARVAGHNAFFRALPHNGVPINTVLTIGKGEEALPLLTITKKVIGEQLSDNEPAEDVPATLLHAIGLGDPKYHNIFRETILGEMRHTVIDIAKFVPSAELALR